MSNWSVGAVVETAAILNGLIVKKGTAENDVLIAGANEAAVGINQLSEPDGTVAVGDHATIVFNGIAKVILGATVARGTFIESDAAGKGVALLTTATTTRNYVGQLLESGVSGDLVAINVNIGFKKIA